MNTKKTAADVIKVLEKSLELKSGSINENTRAEDLENWDSLGHLTILVALDKFFDGKISGINEIGQADSLPKILVALKKNNLI
jgi:acyl carrier protein